MADLTPDKKPNVVLLRALKRNGTMSDNCVICGRWFKGDDCPHSYGENIELIKLAPTLKKLGLL